jgi:hypothetical protein
LACDCHLSRRQAQVERNAGAFARREFFDHAFQMDQFGTEDLQAFSQFFDLMLDVFFYGGSFMKAVTDVDVHEHLGLANEATQPSAF